MDACMLSGGESTFLQQATHLTGGIYLRPKQKAALLQYLLVRFFWHLQQEETDTEISNHTGQMLDSAHLVFEALTCT